MAPLLSSSVKGKGAAAAAAAGGARRRGGVTLRVLYGALVVLLVASNVYFASRAMDRSAGGDKPQGWAGGGEGRHAGDFPRGRGRGRRGGGGRRAGVQAGAGGGNGGSTHALGAGDTPSYKPLKCPEDAVAWADAQKASPSPSGFPEDKEPLWFLHLPRTGGRCFHSCFLKANFPSKQRCAASYDRFHAGEVYRDCRLLGSHDDYSIGHELEAVGREATVITLGRDPVDRFLSSYEFGLSNAARIPTGRMAAGAKHDDLDDEALIENPMLGVGRKVSTQMVWPWSHILPILKADMNARKEENASLNVLNNKATRDIIDTIDPYSNNFYLSLRDFLRHNEIADHVVNGQTMQYVGITNNSHMTGPYSPHDLRHCATANREAGEAIVRLAKRRLDAMPFVGLTKHHHESVELAAAALGFDLNAPAASEKPPIQGGGALGKHKHDGSRVRRAGGDAGGGVDTLDSHGGGLGAGDGGVVDDPAGSLAHASRALRQDVSHVDPTHQPNAGPANAAALNAAMTANPQKGNRTVMQNYISCSLKSANGGSKKNRVGQVKFDHATRARIPQAMLDDIRAAHWMDVAIFEHAQRRNEELKAKFPDRQRIPFFDSEAAHNQDLITRR